MLNNVNVMGRLTADPELKKTPNGVSVCSFTLAVERDIADKQTNERAVDWIDCVAWRGTADFLAKYFSKGRMVAAVGRLQTRTWEDKQGSKHKTTEIMVDHLYFGDSKRDDDGGQRSTGGYGNYGNQGRGFAAAPGYNPAPSFPQGVDVNFDDYGHDEFGDLRDYEDDGELPF